MGVAGAGASSAPPARVRVTLLLDTHFLIWLVLGSERLAEFPWIERYRPWAILDTAWPVVKARLERFLDSQR